MSSCVLPAINCWFVREYIAEKLENGQKILVFAHHRVMIDALGGSLQAKVRSAAVHTSP